MKETLEEMIHLLKKKEKEKEILEDEISELKNRIKEKGEFMKSEIFQKNLNQNMIPDTGLSLNEFKKAFYDEGEYYISEESLLKITKQNIIRILHEFATDWSVFPSGFWKVPRDNMKHYYKFCEREVCDSFYDGFYLIKVNEGVLFLPCAESHYTHGIKVMVIDIFDHLADLQPFFQKLISHYEGKDENIVSILNELI